MDSLLSFNLAHFSDTHLGYEAYAKISSVGNNQRGEDVIRSFSRIVKDIIQADPPLVIHSGDVADHPQVSNRVMLFLMQQMSELAGIRPDGSRRQVIVIAGNHELPRARKEACFLELYANLPGVHVATTNYQRITFDHPSVTDQRGAGHPANTGRSDEVLKDVVVHAVPHDVLKDLAMSSTGGFDDVAPVENKTNILTAHGVAGGSQLYVRSLGREFAIPTDVLLRDWDYVALGHWHKQGPVFPSGGPNKNSATETKVYYAGSSENMGFGDLLDNQQSRGWLSVQVNPREMPTVKPQPVSVRKMFRLPVFDADGLSPDDVTATLVERVEQAADDLDGAVAAQVVTSITRETWSLVDLVTVKAKASKALHFEVTPRYTSKRDLGTPHTPLGDLADQLDASAENVPVRLRPQVLAYAKELLSSSLEERPSDDQAPPSKEDNSVPSLNEALSETDSDSPPKSNSPGETDSLGEPDSSGQAKPEGSSQ